jgi:hypothetical protein
MRLLVVSGSYKNYQNNAVSDQLTDVGGGGIECVGVTVNLLMCDCTHIRHILFVSLHEPATPHNGKYKYDITNNFSLILSGPINPCTVLRGRGRGGGSQGRMRDVVPYMIVTVGPGH